MQIKAFFSDIKSANKAVSKLKNSGLSNAYVDMNDHYIGDANAETNIPGTETSISLSALVLESDAHGIIRDKAPLKAADPMVSGMGRFEEIADVNCQVVVEVSDQEAKRVEQIIKDEGGQLDNPNITKPKLKDERQITAYNALDETRREV